MAALSLLPGVSFRSQEGKSDPLPNGGSLLLVTDHIDSPADFLLIRAATIVLKSSKVENRSTIRSCIFLTFTKEASHWQTILEKANVSAKDSEIVYFECFSRRRDNKSYSIVDKAMFGEEHLDKAYRSVKHKLENNASPGEAIVLMDDLAHLEWAGADEQDIIRFLRSMRSLLRAARASLLVVYHRLAIEPPTSAVHRYLLSTCMAHVDCRPLVSGRSGSVSGELHFHQGPEAWPGDVSVLNRRTLHYRCTDTTAVLFEKGSSTILS